MTSVTRRLAVRSCALRRISAVIVAAAVAVMTSGCAAPPKPAERPFDVEVNVDIERVTRSAGIDLERVVSDAAAAAFARLPHRGQVSIQVRLDPNRTIREVGVGGRTTLDGSRVVISIDDTPPQGLQTAVTASVPASVAHELHHSSRFRMGGVHASSLGQALASEGLADHFSTQLFPTAPRPWDHALSAGQERALWRRARPKLWKHYPFTEHTRWFFGTSDLPRSAGYTLGYEIVHAYLGNTGSAADAVRADARTVIEPYARHAADRRAD